MWLSARDPYLSTPLWELHLQFKVIQCVPPKGPKFPVHTPVSQLLILGSPEETVQRQVVQGIKITVHDAEVS